ncbi:MAG TPA: acyl-CoA dehydrogenase family protein [Trebonia sp.]|nr:acyl-CoA dehydrogenase family protein [Trebonia sp.]
MDFELTEEQAALREVSRGLLAVNCPPQLVRTLAVAGQDVDDKLWQRGAELGWTGLAVPEEHDGAGQGLVELCLVAEELGRAAAPGAFTDTALAGLALARFGHSALLAGLAAGEVKASLAWHGSVAGRDDGGDLLLTGRATAVQAAAAADWLLVPAAIPAAAGDHGRRLVLVERARAAVEPRRTLDETRRWYDVVFDGLRIPAADVVAAAEPDLQWLADAAAVLSAADSLGVGERLLEMTVEYVKVREQFGRPIGSFQSVKHKVTDMLTTLKGARAATYYAAMALDAGVAGATTAASVAKAFTAEGVAALAGEALQTHGGIGFTWEHDLHLYLRRAKVNEMLYGAPAEHYERLVTLLE